MTADIASNFSSVTERVGLETDRRLSSASGSVYVDRDMWEKIVLNLMSNAFKFTLEGQITVRMQASSDGSAAQFSVTDTGIGISPEEFPHLFERFRRIEGARGRSFEGSGIGLALVQELVKLLGGDISVESQSGVGSTFTVTVPFGTAHLPEHGGHRSPKPRKPNRQSLRRMFVPQAYIDEALGWSRRGPNDWSEGPSPGFADSVERARRRLTANAIAWCWPTTTLTCATMPAACFAMPVLTSMSLLMARAAFEIVRHARPDLVLSDVMMPKLDGFGLLSRLRADPELSHIPVLLLSARAGEEAQVEGLGSGADDYLTKPFRRVS